MFCRTLICLLLCISLVSANVEKTIFLGPEPVNIPQQHPTLSDLHIDLLTPTNWSLRTQLEATFPTAELEEGKATWLILDNLAEGQRYEVRICWLATQPTAFGLEAFTLPAVFETPELITSLYNYSISRQPPEGEPPAGGEPSVADGSSSSKIVWADDDDGGGERQSSTLLLRIHAAADYFTTDRALMEHPEPVLVDIILDPFVLNVLPRTLVPTVAYIVFIAAVSWVLSTRLIMPWLRGLMVGDGGDGSTSAEEKVKRQ